MTKEEKTKKILTVAPAVGSIGSVAGIVYGIKKGKSFWGIVGYGLLGGFIMWTLTGSAMTIAIKTDSEPKEKKNETKKDVDDTATAKHNDSLDTNIPTK